MGRCPPRRPGGRARSTTWAPPVCPRGVITTPRGHILLNTGLPSSRSDDRRLDPPARFPARGHPGHHLRPRPHRPRGGRGRATKLLRGRRAGDGQEADLLQSGGTTDYLYGQEPEFSFASGEAGPHRPRRRPHRLRRRHADGATPPGHTRGTTTWTARVMDGGKTYNVVFADGTTVSGTRLAGSRRIRDRGRLPADLRCAGGAEARRLAHRAPRALRLRGQAGGAADRGAQASSTPRVMRAGWRPRARSSRPSSPPIAQPRPRSERLNLHQRESLLWRGLGQERHRHVEHPDAAGVRALAAPWCEWPWKTTSAP